MIYYNSGFKYLIFKFGFAFKCQIHARLSWVDFMLGLIGMGEGIPV